MCIRDSSSGYALYGDTDGKIFFLRFKVVENFALNDEEVDFSKDEGEDTLTILNKYIEDSDFDLSKEIVKNLMKEVYQQACELD